MFAKHRLAAALVLAIAVSLLIATGPAPPARAAASLPPSEWVKGQQEREVVLTFEGPASTKQVFDALETLTEKGAKGAFFLPGSWLSKHKPLAILLLLQGHDLGNRGFENRRFTRLNDARLRASLKRAQKVLIDAGADPRPFMRAPKGARDKRVLRVAGQMGYRSVGWTDRPQAGSASKVAANVVKEAGPGSIISLDLHRRAHRNALGSIIDGLRRRGFELGGLDSLEKAHAVRWDGALKMGSRGDEVLYLQKRLRELTYSPGSEDGVFGEATLQAVYAFEKINGMNRDGVVTPSDMRRIVTSARPAAPDRKMGNYVDVDLSRQVLFKVEDGRVALTLPVSSGDGSSYVSDGETRVASTPTGAFEVLWKIPGWRVSDLGELWYPSYFHSAGYAIHGSPSVPPAPASHGCIRIPMHAAKSFYSSIPEGTKVFVHQ